MAPVNCTSGSNCTNANFMQGDALTGNLLGGITPFFALLGEDFTNRYLSQSVSVCDWVVFAMVPTGVPFALKAIIRVSRPNMFLRGLAVYPQEGERVIEKELLPSTSEEVCEVWNGRDVERKLMPSSGSPVEEWIFDGELKSKSAALIRQKKFPAICELKSTKNTIETNETWKRAAETRLPPNLSLNLGPYNRVRKLTILTLLGIFLQSSVVILSALTAFYDPVRYKFFINATRAVRISSFVFVSAGTALLTSGLLYTASVIDASDYITIWSPKKEHTMVIWKQKKDKHLGTSRYVIGKTIKKELVSAHRPLGFCPSSSISLLVALAIIVGFLLQSIGLSIMHWPVQILQLASMISMFLGRCYVRKLDAPDFAVRLDEDISHEELRTLAYRWRKRLHGTLW